MPLSQPDRGRRAKAAAAVPMNVKIGRATHRIPRLARWLAGRNTLRRPVDRIEGAVMVALIAAFCVAVAMASVFGAHAYQTQRAATSGLRPAVAQLIAAGPVGGGLGHVGQAEAHWSSPAGGEHTGVLTTATAPGITDAAAGARIPVWLSPSGQPVPPPGDQAVMIIYGLVAGAMVATLAGVALLILYRLCRLVLDRRRQARWESAWDRTGPTWTTRR
jgi:hypothetical protein